MRRNVGTYTWPAFCTGRHGGPGYIHVYIKYIYSYIYVTYVYITFVYAYVYVTQHSSWEGNIDKMFSIIKELEP